MFRRIKFIISGLIFLCICILFFIPVFVIDGNSLSTFDFINHYLGAATEDVTSLAQKFEITQIIKLNGFFLALILSSALLGFLTTLLNIFVPNNKSARIAGFIGLAGFALSCLMVNNIYMIVTIKNIDIEQTFSTINEQIFIAIIIGLFVASLMNFIITKIKQPIPKSKLKKQSIFTNFFQRKRKFGTTKRPDFRPDEKTEVIEEQNLRMMLKSDGIDEFDEE